MEYLPVYINIVFVLTTLLTVVLLYKATNYSKPVIAAAILWLALQAVVSLTGFYTVTTGTPPRFGLLLIPPVIFIIILFLSRKEKSAMDGFNAKILTLLHIVRIPVELTLYWLFLHKAVPGIITFEGRNFDILCGLTAPFVYYFGYIKNVLNRKLLIAWNIACLLLLANVVITAVLSAPLPFQKFGFDQPNIALFYFPFIWLPCFIVPAVLFAHLVTLRKLIK
jgi:hypothetical protein